MPEKILLIIFKKEFFRLKVMYLKQKKKNQKMNQKKDQKKNQKKKESKGSSKKNFIEKESEGMNYDLFEKKRFRKKII